MSAPVVSVVVPTHDRAHLLPRLLASLLAQDLADYEVVVVDDGSADATPQVLAACRDPRLRTIRHDRASGVSRARNSGTAAAHGRWVAWCDDDDLWAPDKLRLQLEALERIPGALWCNGGAAHVDGLLQLRTVRSCPTPGDVSREIVQTNVITGGGSGVLADRELVLALGGFDPRLSIYADWHMWARLARVSPLAVVDAPLVAYVDHAAGMSHDRRRLLAEFAVLQQAFAALGDGRGDLQIDARQLGGWMLRQQVGDGRLGATVLLAVQLLRRGMIEPWRVPYSMLGAVVSPRLRRRWSLRRAVVDRRRVEYERQAAVWLAEARRELPPWPD